MEVELQIAETDTKQCKWQIGISDIGSFCFAKILTKIGTILVTADDMVNSNIKAFYRNGKQPPATETVITISSKGGRGNIAVHTSTITLSKVLLGSDSRATVPSSKLGLSPKRENLHIDFLLHPGLSQQPLPTKSLH